MDNSLIDMYGYPILNIDDMMNSLQRVKRSICPGDEFQCPLQTTCCKLSGGKLYGCCPFEEVFSCPIMLIYIIPYYHEAFHFLFRLFAVLMSFIAVLKDLSVLLKRLVSILITLLFHSQLLIDSLVKKISSQGTNICAFKFTMYFLDIRINQSFKILDILGS